MKKLSRRFYAQTALQVAPKLIGQLLVSVGPDGTAAGRIVEVEAYCGEADLACHASRGRTPRTEAMYGPPGHAYMFLLYGVHWAFNVVVAPRGEPHAVLVRAVEPVLGLALMSERRGVSAERVGLTNGPGKLCQALGLNRGHYGADLRGRRVFLAEGEPRAPLGRGPRINVDYAGAWARRPWRFYERGNPWVSVPPRT